MKKLFIILSSIIVVTIFLLATSCGKKDSYATKNIATKFVQLSDGSIAQGIPLTELPIGYNLKGKRIIFTQTHLLPGFRQLAEGNIYNTDIASIETSGTSTRQLFSIYAGFNIKNGDENIIAWSYPLGQITQHAYIYIESSNNPNEEVGWLYRELWLDDIEAGDIIVTENWLSSFPSVSGYWGFDMAYVVE